VPVGARAYRQPAPHRLGSARHECPDHRPPRGRGPHEENPATRFIGIDIGTTAVKAALFDVDGHPIESLREAYPTTRGDDGGVEQDPADWWRLVDGALRHFAKRPDAGSVAAIGITSQANTHVFADGQGVALAPAIVWQDGRSHVEAAGLDATIRTAERLSWWGSPLPVDASHALARMRWMARHRPGIWRRTASVLLPKDWCLQRLTGERVSDPLSNIGLVDLQARYAGALIERVEGAAQRLPALADMASVAGTVRPNLPFAGLPVAVGTMDAWAGVFGTGSTAEGSGLYLSGTSEILGLLSHRVVPTPGVLVMPERHAMRLHVGPTQSGGAAQVWFCDLFGMTPAAMAAAAAQHVPGTGTPLFLPHLQGERAPLWDAKARGTFLGLSASSDRAALAFAVYEGVACSARLLLDALARSAELAPSALNCGGGGFRNDTWNRIRADVLGVDLHRVAATDPGLLGAAGLASVATGHHAGIADAFSALVRIDRTYSPAPGSVERRDTRMALYRDAYAATRSISHRLS